MANEFSIKNGLKFPDATVQTTAADVTLVGVQTLTNKTLTSPKISDFVILPAVAGAGVKFGLDAPAIGWADIIGGILPAPGGAAAPSRTAYFANLYQYAFAAGDQVDLVYHIPHSHALNTDILWHPHWSHNGTAISGNVVFTIYFSYASRSLNGLLTFSAEKTLTLTYNTVNIATTPRYAHRVDEIQITSAGGSATTLDRALIEVDGLILITLKLTTLPSITGGSLFIHTADCHHQSTGILSTKNNAPNYYT